MTVQGRSNDITAETRVRLSNRDWLALITFLLSIAVGLTARDASLRAEVVAGRQEVAQLRAEFKAESERNRANELRIERLDERYRRGAP